MYSFVNNRVIERVLGFLSLNDVKPLCHFISSLFLISQEDKWDENLDKMII